MNATTTSKPLAIDWLTVMAISALAYVLSTALHEHGGHASACVALGGSVRAFGAFYVDCDYRAMGDAAIRLVAIAGPVASVLSGLIAARLLRSARAQLSRLFCWLMASIGLMTGFGYMMFSAVAGIGDFGVGPEGALHGVPMEWLWRVLMGMVGYLLYDRGVLWSMRQLAAFTGGFEDRAQRVRRISLACYIAGCAASVVIGLFNPLGVVIVLSSAAAASLGGTSGFAWGPYRARIGAGDSGATVFPRSWAWIVVAVVVVLAYGVVFGPSISA